MKKIVVSILKNTAQNEHNEYDVLSVSNDVLNESIAGKGTDELKALLKKTIIEFINDDDWKPSDEEVDYCIDELAKGHASNIGAEDFWWWEVSVFTKEQKNDSVSNEVEKELTYKERVKLMADRIAAFGGTMVIWNDKEFHFAFESGWQYRTAHGEMWVKEVKSDNIIVTDGEKNWEIPTSVLDEKFMYQLYITFIKVCERNLTEVAYKEVTLAIGEV